MKNKHRILIIGNAGSGKTYLSSIIGTKLAIVPINLDELYCKPNDLKEKFSFSSIVPKLKNIINLPEWIVEGIYSDGANYLINNSTHLIWLDLEWDTCKKHLIKRGKEKKENFSEKELNDDFEDLLLWASTYSTRNNESSRQEHQEIYNSATCKKIQVKTLIDISNITDNSFLL